MALIVKDRVRETTTTTGTGTLTLIAPVSGFQSFSVIGDGNQTYYSIVDVTTGAWEVGIGIYTSSGTTLSRDTVLESSTGGAKVSFSSGTKDVFVTYPADRSVSQADVGTAPNEIPLNQYLGNLAYQDAANIAGDVGVGGALTVTGNVGIGTTTPVGKLSVVGDILAPSFNTDTTYVIGIQDAQTNTFIGTKRASLKIQASSAVVGGDGMGAGDLTLKAGDAYTSTPNLDGNVNIIAGRSLVNPSFSSGVVTFNTNNTERMRLDVSGNLGLGVTPSAWGTAIRSIDIGFGSALTNANSATATWLSSNAYYTTQWLYKNTAPASYYDQTLGAHAWYTAPSGTAGNAISFTQAMTLTAAGNLVVGGTSQIVSERLGIVRSSAGEAIRWTDGTTGGYVGTIENVGVDFGFASNLLFRDGSTERLRIDTSGNVGIGTNAPNASALLDVQSTTKGVRMPNMTTTEKNAIASPAAGLMVYDTTLAKLCVYTTAWETITSL
jgi:hypothetical protein